MLPTGCGIGGCEQAALQRAGGGRAIETTTHSGQNRDHQHVCRTARSCPLQYPQHRRIHCQNRGRRPPADAPSAGNAGEFVIKTDAVPGPARPDKDIAHSTYNPTKREVEILMRVKRGLTSGQIANIPGLSYYTVQTHRKNISQKLPFTTKKDLYDFGRTLE